MQRDPNDLIAFRDFIVQQVEKYPTSVTPAGLMRQWRRIAESRAVTEDLRVGLAEFEAGGGKPVDEVIDGIRHRLGLNS